MFESKLRHCLKKIFHNTMNIPAVLEHFFIGESMVTEKKIIFMFK